jgi:FkbM family methyltransferase
LIIFSEIKNSIKYQNDLTRKVGWIYGFKLRIAQINHRLGRNTEKYIRFHPPCLIYPVDIRIGSTDPDVYRQVFIENQYAPISNFSHVNTIVDCGANAGYTSAYLLSKYPNANLIAIEPFPENADLCRRNLLPYGSRATVIEAAIWSECNNLVLDNSSECFNNEWGIQVRPANLGEIGKIKAIDLQSLGLNKIDILKIDIEGSEANLFSNNINLWLPKVSNIAIEIHGADCEKIIRSSLDNYSFLEFKSSELNIFRDIIYKN